MVDWVKMLKDYVDTLEAIVGTEGGIALANKLTAARAALIDQITALRMAELDAANIPTDLANIIAYVDLIDDVTNGLAAIKAEVEGLAGAAMRGTDGAALAASWTAGLATILANFTAARIGYLDELDFDLQGTLATIASYIDAEVTAILADTNELQLSLADGGFTNLLIDAIKAETALIVADTSELQTDWVDGGRLDLLLDAVKTQTDKIAGKMLFSMDFWSVPLEVVTLTDIAAPGTDVDLPDVVVDLPAGVTVVRAVAMFKFRMLGNAGAANALQGDQHIGVQKGGAAGYVDAISLDDNMFGIAAATREGGDVVIGDHNIFAKVTADDTYNCRWLASLVDVANLTFNDVQTGLRIWYSV